MHRKKTGLVAILAITFFFALAQGSWAEPDPVEVVFMTTPFGTHMYATGAAAEQVFKRAGSWVHVKHQPTPGAMYMYRYAAENIDKMKTGETPYTLVVGAPPIVDFLAEGRRPFDKVSWPTVKAVVPNPFVMGVYATFNPEIKTLKDLAGKRVCTGERSRPFQGILLDKPLFGVLGIYDTIRWSPLGSVGCKDAFLNGNVDATPLRFMGMVEINDAGMLTTSRCAGGPATMEILNSGRQLHYIPMPPEVLDATRNIPGALTQYPIVFKKGAFEGLDRDLYGRAGPNCFMGDASIPDEIIMEIVRVWHEYRPEFARYADFLHFMPKTPYPVGAERDEVHAGVFKAMEKMALPLPRLKGQKP